MSAGEEAVREGVMEKESVEGKEKEMTCSTDRGKTNE